MTGQFGFGYDALSRRTQLTRPNGINTNYSYDSVSRLLSVLHQAGSTTLDGASYNYDYAGNRTSKTNHLNNITEGYTYDPIYQLTQVTQGASTTESYSYDAVGNRLSSLGVNPYSYNASNQLTATPSRVAQVVAVRNLGACSTPNLWLGWGYGPLQRIVSLHCSALVSANSSQISDLAS